MATAGRKSRYLQIKMTNTIHLGYEESNPSLIRYQTPTDRDFWSWLAGFWEGEGSACIPSAYKQGERGYQRARISASQKVRDPLDYILSQIGLGHICFRSPCYRVAPRWKVEGTFIWSVDKRRDVIYLAKQMRPLVRFRGAAIDRLILEAEAMDMNSGWISWTANETKLLCERFSTGSQLELMALLKRSWPSIRQKATILGLHRNMRRLTRGEAK